MASGSRSTCTGRIYGRNSVDNNGKDLIATVHYGTNYNNAFWNGSQMVFGDGDGMIFRRFTLDVDVIGHELTHGVVRRNCRTATSPGPSTSRCPDVFGSLVKQWSRRQTAREADWLIGEGMFLPGINGVALRSMKAPGTAFHDPVFVHPLRPDGKDPQPDHMSRYVTTTLDNGGVHVNSGIPNKAFFLVAFALEGSRGRRPGRSGTARWSMRGFRTTPISSGSPR